MHLRIPGQCEQGSWDLTPGGGVLGVHYAVTMAEHRTLEHGQGGAWLGLGGGGLPGRCPRRSSISGEGRAERC